MSTEFIIILELVAVQVIVLLISVVLLRDKTVESKEIREVNQALIEQLDQMQAILDGKKENQEKVAESFEDLGDALDEQIDHAMDDANNNIGDMERLVLQHRSILQDLDVSLNSAEPDINSAKSEIKKLKTLLATTEKEIIGQKNKLHRSESDVKSLKTKMRDLSKQILTLNSLEVSEGRLKKDKNRLMDRMEALKEKYDSQKIIARNLENELKTSFKAGEVQAMRDDLRETEETLKRTMIEKAFVEQHFLELANGADAEELDRELKRVKREMRQLEKGILEQNEQN